MKYKYIFFDVANTLLYKPSLYSNISEVISRYGFKINENEIKKAHKIISELILFPDKTSREFYDSFNKEFLYSLGIISNETLLEDIFKSCTYLPWKPFEDTSYLKNINIPMGIISNWDTSLTEKLNYFFDVKFTNIFISEREKLKKPDILFYKKAIEQLNYKTHEILYVGDSLKLDIEPSLKIGIDSILIDREDFFPYYNGKKIKNLNELKSII
jgi:FMN phosphatase YigB (HAD superfamily)